MIDSGNALDPRHAKIQKLLARCKFASAAQLIRELESEKAGGPIPHVHHLPPRVEATPLRPDGPQAA